MSIKKGAAGSYSGSPANWPDAGPSGGDTVILIMGNVK